MMIHIVEFSNSFAAVVMALAYTHEVPKPVTAINAYPRFCQLFQQYLFHQVLNQQP
jgi:hypothetical protein